MSRKRILFDTDPGVDDAMALLLALASPELEVVGVTTVFGNSTVEATTRNALNLLHFAGRTDIPVARGAARPMVLPLDRTAEHVHGEDAMGNIGWHALLHPDLKPIDRPAAQFIAATIMAHPGEITLVAVGPLTNVALALQLEPRLVHAVREVVIMGGTVSTPGNVSPVAEANLYADPHAAAVVFNAGLPLTMVGLDVTMQVKMDDSHFARLRQAGRFGQFVAQIVPFYQEAHRRRYGYPNGQIDTHDPSAMAYAIAPSLFAGERWSMTVVTDGPARGMTIADRRRRFLNTPAAYCLMHVDAPRVAQLITERLAAGA
ncbi:MAG: nucleoside hydrolase [Anaerolineae bacterium]|nr:nucleoside hydrolase [Thermoflexales bacterium]MCX7938567.1 nucleoside hydrolase [Thermoflexales bacterium]MDW8054925.1 nucleoside hydrolase [Anaerolineae bacterium]MDW8396391.1 nucleoside hydrolase [Anaerolineae bacterium]